MTRSGRGKAGCEGETSSGFPPAHGLPTLSTELAMGWTKTATFEAPACSSAQRERGRVLLAAGSAARRVPNSHQLVLEVAGEQEA